jgi:hypothetical protein
MPSPMRSNHPSVRMESRETMMGAGIAEDRVSCESVTEAAAKTSRSACAGRFVVRFVVRWGRGSVVR